MRRSRDLDLCVSAHRGPQVTIRTLTFPGAHAVTPSMLLGVLHGKDVNRPGGTYDEQALDNDQLWLVNEYYERGMIDAKIGTPRLERHGNKLDVAVPIAEGPVFRLGALRGLVVPQTLHRGDVFVRSKVTGGRRPLHRTRCRRRAGEHARHRAPPHRFDVRNHLEDAVVRAALAALALTACMHHASSDCGARGTLAFDCCIASALDKVMVTSGEWAEVDDPQLRAYVHAVGMRLVRAAGDCESWTFRVVDDPDVRGESNTGTTVYVTRGALARLRDEAELAGLLGHEIGHVLAGHAHDALVERARDLTTDTHDRDRDDEIQADELAVLLTARAGYDPRAVETMLRAVGEGEPAGDPDDVHPPWQQRLVRVRAFAVAAPRGRRPQRVRRSPPTSTTSSSATTRASSTSSTTRSILARAGSRSTCLHGSTAELASGEILAAVAGSAVIIKPITRELAPYITPEHDADKLTLVRTGPHGAVMIAIAGPSPKATLPRSTSAPRAPTSLRRFTHASWTRGPQAAPE